MGASAAGMHAILIDRRASVDSREDVLVASSLLDVFPMLSEKGLLPSSPRGSAQRA